MQPFDKEYVCDIAKQILNIDSPTGYTKRAIDFMDEEAKKLGYTTGRNQKGNLLIYVDGKDSEHTLGLSAHLDTLGLMVRSIKDNGKLAITKVGGPCLPTLDGEYCKIYTRDGKVYTGTILSCSPSVHVYPDASTLERKEDTMEVRIDEVVHSKADVEKLGICNGDFICIDTKTQITESGFIKSRFLDDKISATALMGVLKYLKDNNITPQRDLVIMFSTYEEVGHGAAYLPEKAFEILAIDMASPGVGQTSTEEAVTICAKDSSGPYDYDMRKRLVEMAKEDYIDYKIDIYNHYNSDASAAVRAGNMVRHGLIGPGVDASHGYERTHKTGILNTLKLLQRYIEE